MSRRGRGLGGRVGLGLLVLLLPACSVFSDIAGAEDAAADAAHVVLLTEPGCALFIAKTQGGRFAILRPDDAFDPRQGDVLVGELEPGAVGLRTVPFPEDALTEPFRFEVLAEGLTLGQAQTRWRAACPMPARTDS